MASKTARVASSGKTIRYLESHGEPYVTVGALAEYWLVSRKQIYKQIEAGTLPAIRLGPRLYRIPTERAREFEESARLAPPSRRQHRQAPPKA